MDIGFPYEQDFRVRCHLDLRVLAPRAGSIDEERAIESAGWSRIRDRWPGAMVQAWFGEVWDMRGGGGPPGGRVPTFWKKRPAARLVWVVRFSGIDIVRQGRRVRGQSAAEGQSHFTSQFVLVDAKSAQVTQRFSLY